MSLAWIKDINSKFETFVQNRLIAIRNNVHPDNWIYIVALMRIQLTLLQNAKCLIFQQKIYGGRDGCYWYYRRVARRVQTNERQVKTNERPVQRSEDKWETSADECRRMRDRCRQVKTSEWLVRDEWRRMRGSYRRMRHKWECLSICETIPDTWEPSLCWYCLPI